ncbi:MAG: tRNA dihydrouridine synthase DusB [Gammaproteobacteria bacterium]
MRLGPYTLENRLIAAPMAGVTDRPFRLLARRLGAGLAVGEMVTSNPRLRDSAKSRLRTDHRGEPEPCAVQIAGADPSAMAQAARYNAERGARIVDINMGCPAKKVCNAQAGSALLADEPLVERILDAVVRAVDVPVTLKIRTGPSPERRNALNVARMAQRAGVAALTIHGRSRACKFDGVAEYDTIREVKQAVAIPVIANGDIRTPRDAARVLTATGADALMIGRAAQGNPWIFREIEYFLRTGESLPPPSVAEVGATLLEHLEALHAFYGEAKGVRVARKHLSWYCQGRIGSKQFWRTVNGIDCPREQVRLTREYFERLIDADGTRGHTGTAPNSARPVADVRSSGGSSRGSNTGSNRYERHQETQQAVGCIATGN